MNEDGAVAVLAGVLGGGGPDEGGLRARLRKVIAPVLSSLLHARCTCAAVWQGTGPRPPCAVHGELR